MNWRERKKILLNDRSVDQVIHQVKAAAKCIIHISIRLLLLIYKMQLFLILENLLIIQRVMAASKGKKKQTHTEVVI